MKAAAKCFHRHWPAEVCTLGAESRAGLIRRLERLQSFLQSSPNIALADLAYTLNVVEWNPGPYRLAFVASTVTEAAERAAAAANQLVRSGATRINDRRGIYFFEDSPAPDACVAFLFPGEGGQYPGMMSDLCLNFPEVRAWFDRMDRAFVGHERNYLSSQFIFAPPGEHGHANAEPDRLWEMDCAVEGVFAASQALLALLEKLEIRPDALAGHSAGDYSALFASGALRAADDAQFAKHARLLHSVYGELSAGAGIPSGALLAVSSANLDLPAEVVRQSNGKLHIALDNCPHQVILCATSSDAATHAAETLGSAGAVCEVLPFSRAYHTPLFEPVSRRLLDLLGEIEIAMPSVPVYSCVTAAIYPDDAGQLRNLAAAQWSHPVRFRETVEAMYQAGIRIFVEVGPRGNLTAFVNDTLRGRPNLAVASNLSDRAGLVQLQYLVAQLFAAGVPMRLDRLYALRDARRIPLESGSDLKQANAPNRLKLSLRLPVLHLSRETRMPATPPAPPAPAAQPGVGSTARAHALEGFFNNTLEVLETERSVMMAFLASQARPAAANGFRGTTATQDLPFIRNVLSLVPGRKALALCEIDLEEDLFLTHHTLAGKISSQDDQLVGLPVIPLTFSMEMLAEVAALLAPGKIVIGMKDLQASRWLIVGQKTLSLELTASCNGDTDEVRAELRESGASDKSPIVQATVILGDSYPPRGRADALVLAEARGSKWPAGDMYRETGMFHGAVFQLVQSMDRTGADGAQATFVVPSGGRLFRTITAESLIDPVVLDAMGQVVGYWVGDQYSNGLSVFPVRLSRLDLFRGALHPGESVQCRVRVRFVDSQWIRSDIELVGADETCLVRMTGWEDRRLDLPRRFYDFRISPENVLLADSWSDPIRALPNPDAFYCTALDQLPEETFESHGSIWLLVLAYMVLNRNERPEWHALGSSGKRRLDWLMGRIAAKDAVRLWLRDTAGLHLCPADIEITPDSHGALEAGGKWAGHVGSKPLVSISHSGGRAIAVTGRSPESSGIGVDMEQIGRITAEFERLIFTGREQEVLASLGGHPRAEWTTRLWCAKEAVGKALGRGLPAGPASLQIREADLQTGKVRVAVSEELRDILPDGHEGEFTAYTCTDRGYAFGAAVV
jgi:phosphopantetheine--protein transferase-like protein